MNITIKHKITIQVELPYLVVIADRNSWIINQDRPKDKHAIIDILTLGLVYL